MMTTNHIERLDPALIRPGRCDVKVEIRLASKMQIRTLFLRFFPGDCRGCVRVYVLCVGVGLGWRLGWGWLG
jgi:hypothetical protein